MFVVVGVSRPMPTFGEGLSVCRLADPRGQELQGSCPSPSTLQRRRYPRPGLRRYDYSQFRRAPLGRPKTSGLMSSITYNLAFICEECGERHLTERRMKPTNFIPDGTSLADAFPRRDNSIGFSDYCQNLNKKTLQTDYSKVFLVIAPWAPERQKRR
jgi:hypothetical protein